MKKHNCLSHANRLRGFTLIEAMTIVLIITLIAVLGAPLFNDLVKTYRLQQDAGDVERVIRVTMSEAMLRGLVGQVTVDSGNGIITGGVFETDGTFVAIEDFTLREATFGRSNATETPWLAATASTPTTWVGDVIDINANGLVAQSGAVFLNYRGEEAALEVLISGTVSTFFQQEGGASWSN